MDWTPPVVVGPPSPRPCWKTVMARGGYDECRRPSYAPLFLCPRCKESLRGAEATSAARRPVDAL